MKKYLLFFIFSIMSANLFSQIMTPDRVVSMISNRYATIDSFRANFVERNGSRVMSGYVISKSPNLFRMEYSIGTNGRQVYSDGKTLWVILPKQKVVSEQKLSYGNSGAIYTKDGISRLISKYNIDFYRERELKPLSSFDGSELNISGYNSSSYTSSDNRKTYHLLLTPKQASVNRTGFPTVHLWVAEDGMIVRILGISTVNIPVEYLFTDIRYNGKYEDKLFVPVIPEEMQVLKDGLVPGN